MEYKVNDRVVVVKKFSGSIRYVGTVHYAKGTFYGVELDDNEESLADKILSTEDFSG